MNGLAPLWTIIGAASSPAPGTAAGTFWLPESASTLAPAVDKLFYFILGVCTFFFALIVALMLVFVFLYRAKRGTPAQSTTDHSTFLELLWSGIPTLIVIYIFYQGFATYVELRNSPRSGFDVGVVARQWSWAFTYPNGVTESTLHVPVDEPVRLTMRSEDVIHSLFIPAFRMKADVVPGRYTYLSFRAPLAGDYDLLCAEYCGEGHSDMASKVIVESRAAVEAWLKEQADVLSKNPPEAAGKILYQRYGCNACHTLDGSGGTGPTFKGIWGETHEFDNASPTLVDANYVRESILNPGAKVRKGFENKMTSFKGQISDKEIDAIIAFITSLKQ